MLKEIMLGIYATSMFAPVAFVGANIAYYGFNENAQSQEYTVTTYETVVDNYPTSNPSTSVEQYGIYKDYAYTFTLTSDPGFSGALTTYLLKVYALEEYSSIFNSDYSLDDEISVIIDLRRFTLYDRTIGQRIYFTEVGSTFNFIVKDFESSWKPNNSQTETLRFAQRCTRCDVTYSKGEHSVPKDTTTYTNDIVGSLGNAMEHTFEIPVFSWSTSSVLSEPVSNLCGVVGIEDSPLVPLFTYWTTITALFLALDVLVKLPTFFFNR